jgi:glycosyltransferase involved in cell wall biosynthesis
MTVLQLGPYPPPHGGVQTNLVAIREFLRKRGIPSAVVNLTRHRQPDTDDVYYPRTAVETLKLLLRLRYDIIHLHLGGSLTTRLLALSFVCTLMPRSKSVLTFHSGGYPGSTQGRSAHPDTLRGFIFRRFDRIIGVNPAIVEMFHKFGVSRVRLIHPHVLSGVPTADYPARLQYFLAAHKPVLLSVGLLEPEYGLPLQIEALGPVRERFPQAGLLLVGVGSLEDNLRARIQATPYSEHILLWGDLPHSVTLRAIAECDVFLRTTLYDGDSIAVREALGFGTPVIATDNGMRPPGVRLIPSASLEELCRAIEECLAEAHTKRTPVPPGEQNVQAIFDLYRELIPG